MYGFDISLSGNIDDIKSRVVEELQKVGFGVLTEIDVAATLQKNSSYRG